MLLDMFNLVVRDFERDFLSKYPPFFNEKIGKFSWFIKYKYIM